MTGSKQYMNEYMKRRYRERRDAYIEELGGKCVRCKSVENLEFDHINPRTKSYDIAKLFTSANRAMLESEVSKCQLLCTECHIKKTRKEMHDATGQREYWEHGTLGGYRYCRCDLCKKAKSEHNKDYRRRKILEKEERLRLGVA